MIILHVSDIHCETEKLKQLLIRTELPEYNIVAVTGDIECDGEIVDLLNKTGKKILFVPGNMDDISISKIFRAHDSNIDASVKKIEDYIFAGIGGLSVISSLNSVSSKLDKMGIEGNRNLIVLSHHPPRAEKVDKVIIGVHAGLKEIREFILKYKPLFLLHGHIHESPGYEIIGETTVVNAGPLLRGHYALIYVKEKRVENKKLP